MEKQRSLSFVISKNVKGVLGAVTTKLGENDINIENLTIASIDKAETIQKILLYTTGAKIESVINNKIRSLPNVLDAFVLHNNIENKEICLIKIKNTNPKIIKIASLINELNGKSIMIDGQSTVYEIVSLPQKIDEIVNNINELSTDIDIARIMALA